MIGTSYESWSMGTKSDSVTPLPAVSMTTASCRMPPTHAANSTLFLFFFANHRTHFLGCCCCEGCNTSAGEHQSDGSLVSIRSFSKNLSEGSRYDIGICVHFWLCVENVLDARMQISHSNHHPPKGVWMIEFSEFGFLVLAFRHSIFSLFIGNNCTIMVRVFRPATPTDDLVLQKSNVEWR